MISRRAGWLCTGLLVVASMGCNKSEERASATQEPASGTGATTAPAQAEAPKAGDKPGAGAAGDKLGAAIASDAETVTLASVAASPESFKNKTFVTTGTVGAVCQHMGCWMTLKGENGEAFVKMAGHAFAIPKSAAGRQARVLATLTDAPPAAEHAKGHDEAACMQGKGGGCKAEAEAQTGGLAKLELQAEGVELL